VVKLDLEFPVRGLHGEVWGWGATMAPDEARKLAAQLLVAADTASTQLVPVRETQSHPQPKPQSE
jgi:hypothetical protein